MLKYFSLKGRRNRLSFIPFALLLQVFSRFIMKSNFLDVLEIIEESSFKAHEYDILSLVIFFQLSICFLGFFQVQNIVKRLHDVNISGWWVLCMLILTMLYDLQNTNPFIPIAQYLLMIPSVILFITCLFMPGTKGENRFGDDPLEGK